MSKSCPVLVSPILGLETVPVKGVDSWRLSVRKVIKEDQKLCPWGLDFRQDAALGPKCY